MELSNKSGETCDGALYRALSCGDLPAAYIISNDLKKRDNAATCFNCGLCLYALGEYEKSLAEFKNAEKTLGVQHEYDISERKSFIKAFAENAERETLLPLDPDAPKKCGRFALIRTKWLIALCLKNLGRDGEAAPYIRFLSQYDIKI